MLSEKVTMIYQVKSSKHEHGVKEHEEPAGNHLETVEENGLGADVAKAENKNSIFLLNG